MIPSGLDMPINVRGRRVLVLGDSLSASSSAPGGVLGKYIRNAGAADVRVNGKVSRSAVNFFAGTNGENGALVLANEVALRPDVVIVWLGTNDLGLSASVDAAAFARIRDAFRAIGAEVWSIGPPAFATSTRTVQAVTVYGTLSSVFGADRVLDSRPLTADVQRTADGVHFPAASAATVGARLAAALLPGPTTSTTSPSSAMTAVTTTFTSWLPVSIAAAAIAAAVIGLAVLVKRRRVMLTGPTTKHEPSRVMLVRVPGLFPGKFPKKWRVTGEGKITGVELEWIGDPTRYALAHPAITDNHKWQVTWFDADGAGGDVRRSTLEKALNDGADAYTYRVTRVHTR